MEHLTRFAGKTMSFEMAIARCNKGKRFFDRTFASLFDIALHVKRQIAG
jgi:hypothetical protein